MAPEREDTSGSGLEAVDPTVGLMYLANEGDMEGIKELLDGGSDVNFRDIDDRTALHVAACQRRTDVVHLLLQRGAEVDPQDRWGSTVIMLLFSHLSFFDSLLVAVTVTVTVTVTKVLNYGDITLALILQKITNKTKCSFCGSKQLRHNYY